MRLGMYYARDVGTDELRICLDRLVHQLMAYAAAVFGHNYATDCTMAAVAFPYQLVCIDADRKDSGIGDKTSIRVPSEDMETMLIHAVHVLIWTFLLYHEDVCAEPQYFVQFPKVQFVECGGLPSDVNVFHKVCRFAV